MTEIVQKLKTAIDCHQTGRLARAEQLYQEILQTEPRHVDALHLLGVLAHQTGRNQTAVEMIARAIALRPRIPEFHENLAVAHLALGHIDEAVVSCRQALAFNPDSAGALNSLGNALEAQGQAEEAARSYRRALRIEPDRAVLHFNLGNALRALGRLDEAAASYRRALAVQPEYARAHKNLGNTLTEQGRVEQAAEHFRAALRIDPTAPEVHFDLAGALADLGEVDEAAAGYRRAVELKPDYVEAHGNLASLLQDQGDFEAAEAGYRATIELQTDSVEAHHNLGMLLAEQGRLDEARDVYRRLQRIEPEQPLWRLRQAMLQPLVYASGREMDQAYQELLAGFDAFVRLGRQLDTSDLSVAAGEPPFAIQFHKHNVRPIKEAYARIFNGCFSGERPAPRTGRPRIGVVVTRGHESVFLRSLGGVLARIDPGRFEIVVVCHRAGCHRIRQGISSASVAVRPLGEPLDRAAETIRSARFDLLYYWEIGTDPTNYFLPFFRLAPVQCTSWGIQVTSAIPQVDYYLSSRLVEPEHAEEHYSERLLLAETLLSYRTRARLPRPAKKREQFGLSEANHLYVCAQQLGKFHPDFDPLLAAMLRHDPAGRIVVTGDRSGCAVEILRQRWATNMPNVADRMIMLPRQTRPDYLALVATADVLLDPPYFSGVNTTYDGLSLGKAIVTLPSEFHRGRYTLGCYRKMGFDRCVASDAQDYVDKAVRLGTEPDYRASVAQAIDETSPVLFEDTQAVTEHERLFSELIEEARCGR